MSSPLGPFGVEAPSDSEIIQVGKDEIVATATYHDFTFPWGDKKRRTLYSVRAIVNNSRLADVYFSVGLKAEVAHDSGTEQIFHKQPTVPMRANSQWRESIWNGAMPFTRNVSIEFFNVVIGDELRVSILWGEPKE